ncbi:hypothetical protein ACNKHO_06080 [Shigella flexneri]
MFSFEGNGFPFQQTSPDAGNSRGSFITLGMIEEDAVARQLLRIAARYQVEQRAAVREPAPALPPGALLTVGEHHARRRATA